MARRGTLVKILAILIPGGLLIIAAWWLSRYVRSLLGVLTNMPDMPLGIRLNNPMNLSYRDQNGNPIPWVGLTGYGMDANGKSVAKFDTSVNGIRAGVRNFRGYGLNTLGAIAAQWVGDPDEQSDYVENAAFGSGLNPSTVLDLNDPQTCVKVAKGIVTAEEGKGPWYSDATYLAGVNAAGVM